MSKVLQYNGLSMTYQQWAAYLGISLDSFRSRLKNYKQQPEKLFHKGAFSTGRPKGQRPWNYKWGKGHEKEYNAWWCMRNRCYNKKSRGYKNYGARGIKVCKHWGKFENFISDMGKRPDNHSLERKNNNKGYSPSNCIWATKKVQVNNTRRNVVIEHKGMKKTLAQWAEFIGLNYQIVYCRIKAGWPISLALYPQKLTPRPHKRVGATGTYWEQLPQDQEE